MGMLNDRSFDSREEAPRNVNLSVLAILRLRTIARPRRLCKTLVLHFLTVGAALPSVRLP